MSAYYPNVTPYKNGQRLDADTLNTPISQLEGRTAWLKDRLDAISSKKAFSSVRLPGVEIDDGVSEYDCVCLDRNTGVFRKALASVLVESNPNEISDALSFAVGIVVPSNQNGGTVGQTVAMYGLFEFPGNNRQIRLANLKKMLDSKDLAELEATGKFQNGPYYLSNSESGKITRDPRGPAIHIGIFNHTEHATYALLAPQYKDLAEMHYHRAFALSTKAQGSIRVLQPRTPGEPPRALLRGIPSIDGNSSIHVVGTFTGTSKKYYRLWVAKRVPQNNATSTIYWDTVSAEDYTEPPNNPPTNLYVLWQECASEADLEEYSDLGVISGSVQMEFELLDTAYYIKPFRFGSYGLVGDFATSHPTQDDTWELNTEDIVGWVPSDGKADYTDGDEVHTFSFMYPVGLDTNLNKFFPPYPSNGAALVINGTERTSYDLYGDNSEYRLTNTGLYWRSIDATATPFNVPDRNVVVSSTLYLSRGKLPSSSFVTSIKAAEGSGIKIREEGTSDTASTGNLVIDANIPIKKANPGLSGHLVPKDVSGNTLIFGGVVSSIKGIGLTISSPQGKDLAGGNIGDVLISTNKGMSGMFDDIILNNAKQELIGPFPYIKLLAPTSVASGFTLKMHVPFDLDSSLKYKLLFYMSVFGLQDITEQTTVSAAPINVGASILQDWYPGADDSVVPFAGTLKDPGLVVLEDRNFPILLGGLAQQQYADGQYYYKSFDPIFLHNDVNFHNEHRNDDSRLWKQCFVDVRLPEVTQNGQGIHAGLTPNSTLAITVSRTPAGEMAMDYQEYQGELGFMNLSWKLVEAYPDTDPEGD